MKTKNSLEDQKLIQNAQQGDIHSFEKLVYRYDKRVMALIRQSVANDEDAKELYQDVFIKVFHAIKQYHQKSSFYTWLFRITVNCCLNFHQKKSTRQDQLKQSIDTDTYLSINTFQNPESNIMNQELQTVIQNGLDTLSSKEKIVFNLKHLEGLKIREIAHIFAETEGSIKNCLFRGIRKLKNHLTPYINL